MTRIEESGSMIEGWGFNPPPYWPKPPEGWTPPAGWLPDPAWGPVPPGWQLWVPARPTRRRRGPLLVGGTALLAAVAIGVVVPWVAGPGVQDSRAAGVVRDSSPLAALIDRPALEDPAGSDPAGSDPAAGSAIPAPTSKPAVNPTSPPASPSPSAAAIREFRNCADLNRTYPNGIGMPDAVDRTSGTPVSSFGRSTTIYHLNLKYDRDGDGIACEPQT